MDSSYCSTSDELFISGVLSRLARVTHVVSVSFGSAVAIVFVGVDAWKAFKKSKHWIPGDSLALGALTLQLLTLLNRPSAVFNFPANGSDMFDYTDKIVMCSYNASRWILVMAGRVSVCVVMGCMLPGVARTRSTDTNLWSDMAALIISSSLPIFHLLNEIYVLIFARSTYLGFLKFRDNQQYEHSIKRISELLTVTVTILISILILLSLLASAALASVSIHQTVSHQIPVVLSRSTTKLNSIGRLYFEILWVKVEEQVLKSWIVVRTSDPQYIISRSVLSSSIALVTMICNGILVFGILRTKHFSVSTPFILHCVVIAVGSAIIYWRWITAVLYYPRNIEWKWRSIRKCFEIEDFWKRFLLEVKDSYTSDRVIEESYLKKLMIKLCGKMRLHKLVPPLLWLQMLLILFSKGCWLLSQLLLSNIRVRKLFMRSACEEFPNLYEGKGEPQIQLGKETYYNKYLNAFITMQGENPAGLWIANRKSIESIKKQMISGEEEGKICDELIALLKNKSSSGFSRHRRVDRPNGVLDRLEVEMELDTCKHSCKMTAVSIIIIIIELSSFMAERIKTVDAAIEACSQAWGILDLVENSDSQVVPLSKVADKLFQNMEESRKWLTYHLPMRTSVDMSTEAAKVAIENLVEKGKEIASACHSRPWDEVVAGYSLWRVCVGMDYLEFNKVEGILNELLGVLADVIGSSTVKAVDVIMEDSEKWATRGEEENIWKAAHVAGKVKGVTEKMGWRLKWNEADTEDFENAGWAETSRNRDEIPNLKRHQTFQCS